MRDRLERWLIPAGLVLADVILVVMVSIALELIRSGSGAPTGESLAAGSPTPTLQASPPVLVELVARYSDGSERVLYAASGVGPTATVTATSSPTATLTATATVTPMPTGSPTPTQTATLPSPTPTPLLTPSATPVVSPTWENTPPPTVTIPPPLPQCELKVKASAINLRAQPSTGATILGKVAAGQTVAVDRFELVLPYLWAHIIDTGWFAVRVRTSIVPEEWEWGVDGVDSSQGSCQDQPGWPDGLDPPPPLVYRPSELGGLHILLGAIPDRVLPYVGDFGTWKCLTSTEAICLEGKRRHPDLVLVFRSLNNQNGQTDGPVGDWEWYNPDIYYAKLRLYLPAGFDYYEFVNEQAGPSWSTVADFSIQVLSDLAAEGKCGLFGSFGPGNPPFDAWDDLVRVLRWIDDHPCGTWPNGATKYHGLALHQPGLMPITVPVLPNSWIRSDYFSGRDRLVAAYLKDRLGYDLAAFRGPIYLTELGWQDYTIPNETFTCDEVAAGYALTKKMYQALSPWVWGFQMWNVGGQGQWVDLTACLPVVR